MLPTKPTELDACGYYDDWFRPDMAQAVIDATYDFEDWELEVLIAAQAVYANSFLNPN